MIRPKRLIHPGKRKLPKTEETENLQALSQHSGKAKKLKQQGKQGKEHKQGKQNQNPPKDKGAQCSGCVYRYTVVYASMGSAGYASIPY